MLCLAFSNHFLCSAGVDFYFTFCYLMMQNMYRKAAEFWAELRVELLSAIEYYAEDKGNSSQIWRLYWASHQVVLFHFT